jgi:glycosyltransferase involved in cell wall biosynthesis
MKKLTIGSTVHDDFDGIFFTYQSIRLNNLDIEDQLDLIVIDNNPSSAEGKETKSFCEKTNHIRYMPYTKKKSSTIKNAVFEEAEGEYVLYLDAHILLEPNTIKKLISFYESDPQTKNLHQGPLFLDCMKHNPMTHMDPTWRGQMWGTWGIDEKGINPENPPFEIPMHGTGLMSCRKDAWLGFNEKFIGFGGEEGYIHEKYRQHGHKTLCLPFLRWMHRFGRPRGVPYPLKSEDRIHNYIVGFRELGLDLSPVINHFNQELSNFSTEHFIKTLDQYREQFLQKHSTSGK